MLSRLMLEVSAVCLAFVGSYIFASFALNDTAHAYAPNSSIQANIANCLADHASDSRLYD